MIVAYDDLRLQIGGMHIQRFRCEMTVSAEADLKAAGGALNDNAQTLGRGVP